MSDEREPQKDLLQLLFEALEEGAKLQLELIAHIRTLVIATEETVLSMREDLLKGLEEDEDEDGKTDQTDA